MNDKNSNILNEEQKKIEIGIENIKSNYILKKIFDCMKRNIKLKIMKCNKILQKRLNLTIKDYLEYSQLYSTIELEFQFSKIENNSKFILNYRDKKKYYHFYLDNSNEELKFKNKLFSKLKKAKTITIRIDYKVDSLNRLFSECDCIKSINFKKFYRTNITDMSHMFDGCSSLEELNLSNFNTNNVTDMNNMFKGCSSLEELNLSNFKTNNVINMFRMFFGCSFLEDVNLSNFNTNNVTNMREMFYGCSLLKELNN